MLLDAIHASCDGSSTSRHYGHVELLQPPAHALPQITDFYW